MVDDLKARLRNWSNGSDDEPPIRLMQAAADRIEALEGLENFVSCAENDVTMEMARQLFDLTDHSSVARATLSDSSAK